MLVEFDLAGAEWVIVAFLSEDENMMRVARSGKSPHVATGSLMSRAPEELVLAEHELLGSASDPDLIDALRKAKLPELVAGDYFLPRSMSIRQAGKKGNHGLNYGLRYRHFALLNEMPENDAKQIVDLYSTVAYPGILDYHEGIKHELRHNDRTLVNLMGRKVRLLDQSGPDLWNAAYSFKPQSTVADICIEAMCTAYADTSRLFEPMGLSANVYDSLLFQYPAEPEARLVEWAVAVREMMSPLLVANGHEFTLGVDCKVGDNWGDMTKLALPPREASPAK